MFLAPKKKYNLTPFTDKRLNKVIAKGDLKSKGWKKGDVETGAEEEVAGIT